MFIHLGSQKTGSKAIQNLLTENNSILQSKNLVYPENFSKGVWHRDLFMNFSTDHRQMLEELTTGKRRPIISFENAYEASQSQIADVTRGFSNIELLFFTRHPTSWINSFKNQIIKAHKASIKTYRNFDVTSSQVINKFRWDKYIENWRDNADIAGCRVENYSGGIDVLSTTLNWLGVSEYEGDFVRQETNPNKALDVESARIFLALKEKIEGVPDKTRIEAIRRAHSATKEKWIDTHIGAGMFLLSSEEVDHINTEILPIANRALKSLGAHYSYDAYDWNEYGGELTDLKPRPETMAAVEDIVKDLV